MNYHLAIDIGASSGRHILSHVENGKILLEEIHRFENGPVKKGNHLVWDCEKLFNEIITGLQKCKEAGKIPQSLGIDTWAVDFAVLDENDKLLGDTVCYRDNRTAGMDTLLFGSIPEENLYKRTGIQKQPFNTIYQLMALREFEPDLFSRVKTLLLIPDYLNFLLTGVKVSEYTNASTTQLVSPLTKDWDYGLINILGFPSDIFCPIKTPTEKLGPLKEDIARLVGFNLEVVLPATHDTASAVMAVPSLDNDTLYISSGTWSLMGTELKEAILSEESRKLNLTNEGGFDYRFRYLKNIMGMWMINSLKNEMARDVSFDTLCSMAAKETIPSIVDANNDRFLAPKSMYEEVRKACKESFQPVPETVFETAAVIYNSLAACYQRTFFEIEKITGKTFSKIHIVGGGSKAEYLNRLTAKVCKRPVLCGPVEATAIGNIAAQMIAFQEFEGLEAARKAIFDSFEITQYEGE